MGPIPALMDSALALTLGGAGLFGLGIVASTWRQRRAALVRARAVAEERGLESPEYAQLEHLGRYADHATPPELMLSPIRYDRAVAAYVADLRRHGHPPAHYFGIIVELTRLRRRVHPTGHLLRWLVSTRELPEAADLTVGTGLWQTPAVVWSVNEDHFDLRVQAPVVPDWLEPGTSLQLRLSLPGHGLYEIIAELRMVTGTPRRVLRVEHGGALTRDNRRQFVREPAAAPVLVTPELADGPVDATLRDLSGGGVSFLVDAAIPLETRVKILLPLGESEAKPLILWLTVLRCDLDDDAYRIHGSWEGLTSDQLESIVRFVFDLQRRRIRLVKAAARLGSRVGASELVLVPAPTT